MAREEETDAAKLSSFIKVVTARWKLCHDIWAKENQNKVTKYKLKKSELEAKKSSDQNLAAEIAWIISKFSYCLKIEQKYK